MTEAQKAKRAAYNRAWQRENPERVQAALKRYREKHPEKVREWRRASYQRNREKTLAREREKRAKRIPSEKRRIAEYQRAYREANRDSIAEYHRAYYEANRDSIAEKQRWIADERKARGYTQQNLAEFTGCSQSLISLLESGKVPLEKCARRDVICRFLKGVSYDELMAQGI